MEVVGKVDLAHVGVLGGGAIGDDVVDGVEVEVCAPRLDECVHPRADDVVGDSLLPGAVDAVVK